MATATLKKSSNSGKTVLETILAWSQGRPIWQRDALRRIVSNGRLDADDIKELIDLCKLGRGAKGITLDPIPLGITHIPANPDHAESVSLVTISEVDGVNNLAPGQTLSFEPNGITIIYGNNGAGKSGYARILKRACRARYAGKIEPNVYAPQPLPACASATVTYSIGGVQQSPEKWQDGDNPHPILSAITVFDSDCASVHIKEKNEVAFRPFGLDVPDELAGACQALKDALTNEQRLLEKGRSPIFSKPSWGEATVVGKTLAALKHDADLQKIETLAILTDEEVVRLNRLREDLSKSPAKAAAEQTLKSDNIKRLRSIIDLIMEKTSDEALSSILTVGRDARLKREVAVLAAKRAFSGEQLEGIGGEVWRTLWDSARAYSTLIAYPGQAFPSFQDGTRCVLCQQTLDAEACARMGRFEAFVQEDTEQQAQKAEQVIKLARQGLRSLSIGIRPITTNLQEIAIQNPDLARRTRRFLSTAAQLWTSQQVGGQRGAVGPGPRGQSH